MLFVFLSHFVVVYFARNGRPASLVWTFSMIASPAFISISGVLLGILFCTRPERYPKTKWSFVRRGIFLLTVGRAFIFLAHIPLSAGWRGALRWGFMTDAIGFCIIFGPLLMERVDRRQRMLLGGLIYGFSWLMVLLWMPVGPIAEFFKETLVGSFRYELRFFTDVFPILPWFGLYIVATAFGQILGDQLRRKQPDRLLGIVFRIGAIGVASAVCLSAIRLFLGRELDWPIGDNAYMLASPSQKLPPGPVYVLFYGGCTLLMLFILMRYRNNRAVENYSAIVEVLGRNSLFVFIVQYFIYFSLFVAVDFPPTSLWPLYFLVSVAVIWGLALLWERGNMNKYLTIPALDSVRGLASKS